MSRRDEGALAELEREAGIVPENAKLALEMSRVYSRLGDREKAHSQAGECRALACDGEQNPGVFAAWGRQ